MKFEEKNWQNANTAPAVTATPQVCLSPRTPSTSQTRNSGMNRAMIGDWRPAMWPKVTDAWVALAKAPWVRIGKAEFPRVVIGAPIAPKATGAVLATMQTTAARIGFMPAATSMAAVIATGEPKPASASRRAPKQKAIRMASTRMSVEIDCSNSPSTLSQPCLTERL